MENDENIFAQRKDAAAGRKGDWMECFGGAKFYPLDPRPEEVDVLVVAHHLSRMNRYNGAFRLDHFSVAEHAVVMAEAFIRDFPDEPYVAYQALHHDDAEAYISDMIRPLKRNIPQFTEIEFNLWDTAIAPALCLPTMADMDPRVKAADNRILVDEREQVVGMSENQWGIDGLEPLRVQFSGWEPFLAKARYLELHERLSDRIDWEAVLG